MENQDPISIEMVGDLTRCTVEELEQMLGSLKLLQDVSTEAGVDSGAVDLGVLVCSKFKQVEYIVREEIQRRRNKIKLCMN